nr:hypothetical protein HK105_006120 [Polyrhizophydium stewartii]
MAVAALVLAPACAAVKHSDFKGCAASGFCVRQQAFASLAERGVVAGAGARFSVVPASVALDAAAGRVTALLMGLEPTDVFSLRLDVLRGGAVRLRVDERDPLLPRFAGAAAFALATAAGVDAPYQDAAAPAGAQSAAKDDVPLAVPSQAFVAEANTKDELRLRFGDAGENVLTMRSSPFRIELAVNGELAIVFNGRGFLNIEQLRKKDDAAAIPRFAKKAIPENPDDPVDDATREINELKDKFVEGMWEETFGGRTDSKPRGAAYSDPYRLYNLDVFEYELDNPMALYGSVPFMMSHRKDLSVAVLLLNSAEMWVDVEKPQGATPSVETHWMAESGVLDLFFFLGPTQENIFDSYTALTGRPAMPQQFAIAYHQCRWNYNNEEDVKAVDAGFDEHDIPYDVLWLDIEHTDGKRYFTWDGAKFPTPDRMQNALATRQRKVRRMPRPQLWLFSELTIECHPCLRNKMVTIIDPHIKKDNNYAVSKQALDAGLFVKDVSSNAFDGFCWPGDSNWIDYTNPAGRAFWVSKFAFSEYKGSTPSLYTWNDMNEPSVFNGPEITMPKDNLHFNNWEHRHVHNAYGMLLHRATFEGHLARASNADRPFVLSRAYFAGTQRYGAIWTGDNFAQWDHLAASVPMILSTSIAGVTFAGADVGGFFGNPEPDLLVRWYQTAAFQPFFRAHAHIDTKRREPWLFGEPYTSLIREAIRRRYKLLPYLYTLFSESSRTGNPVMRSMVQVFPSDEATFAMDDQFMLGSALLVKPVSAKDQASVDVYLPPSSTWFHYDTFIAAKPSANGMLAFKTPLEAVPVFLRGGSIVPRRDRIRRSSSLTKKDPYTLVVALDKNGEASGSIYIDDGKTYAFNSGAYIFSTFEFKNGKLTAKPARLPAFSVADATPAVLAELGMRVERVVVVGLASAPKSVSVAGGRKAGFKATKASDGTLVVTVKNPAATMGDAWALEFA